MKNFVQPGDVIDHLATAALSSGQVVVIGQRLGVAVTNARVGERVPLRVRGVVELAKKAADAVAQGDLLYWAAADGHLTTTKGNNTLAGYATAAAGAGSTTACVHLNA